MSSFVDEEESESLDDDGRILVAEGLLPEQYISVDIQVGEEEERVFRCNLSETA